jgi:ribosomal protein L16/L10AE
MIDALEAHDMDHLLAISEKHLESSRINCIRHMNVTGQKRKRILPTRTVIANQKADFYRIGFSTTKTHFSQFMLYYT